MDQNKSVFHLCRCNPDASWSFLQSCIRRCKQECAESAQTLWLNVETNESVQPSRREGRKTAEAFRADMQLKSTPTPHRQFGFWLPSSFAFKELPLFLRFTSPGSFPGWWTAAYWSPRSQAASVSPGRVLVGFINKRYRLLLGPKRSLYLHLISF